MIRLQECRLIVVKYNAVDYIPYNFMVGLLCIIYMHLLFLINFFPLHVDYHVLSKPDPFIGGKLAF